MLYTPAGYLAAHRIMNGANVLGLRCGCVSSSDEVALEALIQSHTKAGKTPTVAIQAMELIGVMRGGTLINEPDPSSNKAVAVEH